MTNFVITLKQLRSPPLNHIFSYSLWHESSRRIFGCIPRGSPIPLNMTKLLIIPKRFRSPPLNHIFSYSLWYEGPRWIFGFIPRVSPTPHNMTKLQITPKRFRSPPLNHIFSYFIWHGDISSILNYCVKHITVSNKLLCQTYYNVLLLTCRRHTSSGEDSKLSFLSNFDGVFFIVFLMKNSK